MSSFTQSRRGQTLVEALVALSILTVGFVGIVTLLTKSFQLNRTVANDTQSTYLAAEGIELTKNMIDHDVYAGFSQSPGDDFFGKCFFNGTPRLVYFNGLDYTTTDCNNVSFSPPAPGADQLYFNPKTQLFSFDSAGGTPSNFTRDVTAQDEFDASGDLVDVDVQSTVTWHDGGLSNTIMLEDHFYHWHP